MDHGDDCMQADQTSLCTPPPLLPWETLPLSPQFSSTEFDGNPRGFCWSNVLESSANPIAGTQALPLPALEAGPSFCSSPRIARRQSNVESKSERTRKKIVSVDFDDFAELPSTPLTISATTTPASMTAAAHQPKLVVIKEVKPLIRRGALPPVRARVIEEYLPHMSGNGFLAIHVRNNPLNLEDTTESDSANPRLSSVKIDNNGSGSRISLPFRSSRNFRCRFCRKAFRQRSNVVAHVRVHTQEKPFRCYLCNRGFKQNSNLKRHEKVHSTRAVSARPPVCRHPPCGEHRIWPHERMHRFAHSYGSRQWIDAPGHRLEVWYQRYSHFASPSVPIHKPKGPSQVILRKNRFHRSLSVGDSPSTISLMYRSAPREMQAPWNYVQDS
ncbi:hypothetical protein AAMO2058_000558900 [Amorphochlora amoebiformis]